MATKIYDTFELELENGLVVNLKPLPIKHLRKFMDIIGKMSDEEVASSEMGAIDVFVEAAIVCLRGLQPDDFKDMKDPEIEEILTVPTMLKILDVAGGLKTTDPNLMGAALAGAN